MENTVRIMTFLLVGAFTVGCKAETNASPSKSKLDENVSEQRENAKQATRKAAQAMEKYGYARKEQFVHSMKKELADVEKDIDRLTAKVDSSTGAVKAEAKDKLEAVRLKWNKAREQLDEAESATEDNWDNFEGEFRKANGELKSKLDDVRVWLAKKIMPT